MEEKATLDAVEFQMGVLCSSLGTWIDKYVKTTMSCSLQYTTHLSRASQQPLRSPLLS